MYRNKGFTLIELVIVIVILGLLAATALPRFINLQTDAREAVVQGVAGGLRSAASLSRAYVLINGSSSGSIPMEGINVAVNASGYPTNAAVGIVAALQDPLTDWTINHNSPNSTFVPPNAATPANCVATYNSNTGAVTVDVTNCN